MKYNEMTLGQMEAVINKLGGMDGVRRFLTGELIVKEIERVFKTWKTIKIGTGLKIADDFRKAIKKAGMRISDYANDILGKPAFTVAIEKTEIDLVIVSVGELGFKDGARREDIYARAQELGLQRCPNEVGPQLRLQYKDQPNNEWLIIAMEPISDSDGGLELFVVVHNGLGQWLGGYYDDSDDVWDASYRFVFVLPRK